LEAQEIKETGLDIPSHFGSYHLFSGGEAVVRDAPLLRQLRVLSVGLLQDWDIRVSVFPEREEIFVGGECPDASGIGFRSLRRFSTARHSREPLPGAPTLPSSSSRRCRGGGESSETRRQQ